MLELVLTIPLHTLVAVLIATIFPACAWYWLRLCKRADSHIVGGVISHNPGEFLMEGNRTRDFEIYWKFIATAFVAGITGVVFVIWLTKF